MKIVLTILLLVAIGGAAYWYGSGAGWFADDGITNPPTEEEWERIHAVEESSSQQAPDAKAGIGVVPVGSKPEPVEEPLTETEEATTTEAQP